jgi:hypothetical protein
MRKSASEIIRNLEGRIARLESRSASRSDEELTAVIETLEGIMINVNYLDRVFDDWAMKMSVRTEPLPSSYRPGDIEKAISTCDDLLEMKDAIQETHRLLLKLR